MTIKTGDRVRFSGGIGHGRESDPNHEIVEGEVLAVYHDGSMKIQVDHGYIVFRNPEHVKSVKGINGAEED
jgi:flavin reductase (DIM6/NTAB) family NADH-FMN oxidoreductase RutF